MSPLNSSGGAKILSPPPPCIHPSALVKRNHSVTKKLVVLPELLRVFVTLNLAKTTVLFFLLSLSCQLQLESVHCFEIEIS